MRNDLDLFYDDTLFALWERGVVEAFSLLVTVCKRSGGKVIFLRLSVILFTMGCTLPMETPSSRQPPVTHPSGRQIPYWADTRLSRHPPETATAADDTHPTGMHSCLFHKTKTSKKLRNQVSAKQRLTESHCNAALKFSLHSKHNIFCFHGITESEGTKTSWLWLWTT